MLIFNVTESLSLIIGADMSFMEKIAFGLLGFVAFTYAGGAASFVAKKSNTGEFPYSETTQQEFMKDCSENANEWVCGCVLARLQGSYSEKEYLKLDASLQKGHEDYDFVSFLSNSVEECDGVYEAMASLITEEEAMAYIDNWFKTVKRKDAIKNCPSEMKDFYGKKEAEKVCGCVYDRMAKDKNRLAQVIMEEGYPDDKEKWGLDYLVECVPDKFTPEMEKNFIKFMNERGIPRSSSQCILKSLKKEYSLKSFIASAKENMDLFTLIFTRLATKCLVE